MKVSDKGFAMIAALEGLVPGPYLDSAGVWTYGIGHTAKAGPPDPSKLPRGIPAGVPLDDPISRAIAQFRVDIAEYEAAVQRAVTVPVSQQEFDALVSFHYNTGGIARAKLTQHLNRGDRKAAAAAFMGWANKPRRNAERTLFEHGIYGSTAVPVWPVDANGKVTFRSLRVLYDLTREAKTTAPSPVPAKASPFAGLMQLIARLLHWLKEKLS